MDGIYFFNGKDITMNMCIQIRDVIDIIQKKSHLSFPDATLAFYQSQTYKALQKSAEYIADRYYEEQEAKELQNTI